MSTKNKNQQNRIIDGLGDWNPQIFREIKGRFKPKNIAIAAIISGLFQLLFYWNYQSDLPEANSSFYSSRVYSRYCLDLAQNKGYCVLDSSGNFAINWPLWWLDIFVWTSVIGIFILAIAGVYLLVADLSKEKNRGTLNFIRMSPQTATNILIGKILGVPILLYFALLLALPLHLIAGLSAGIPLSLILVFDGVVIASCGLFYSVALLLGLTDTGMSGLKTWLGTGFLLLFLYLTTLYLMSNGVRGYIFDWLTAFNPINALFYLVDASSVDVSKVGNLSIERISKDSFWYGAAIWQQAWSGIGFLLLNFALWTYWIWQGVKRSFNNPISTVFSKKQSYLISASFTIIALGFSLENPYGNNLTGNFAILQILLVCLFLAIIAAISPPRQTLQDWARYRHQNSNRKSLISDLIWGEKSPSTLAIAINILIAAVFLSAWIVISFPEEDKIKIFANLVLFAGTMVIFAAIAQLILFMKTPKRAIFAAVTVVVLTIMPLFTLGLFRIDPSSLPSLYFFTVLPMVAIETAKATTIIFSLLGQWLAIALLGFRMTKQLQKAGESETKALLK